MTKNVQALAAQLASQQQEIDGLNEELARCEAIISAADMHEAEIVLLTRRRTDELANALIDRRAADTAGVDADIAKIQKASVKGASDRIAAGAAIPILKGRIHDACGLMAETNLKLSDAVTQDLVAQHDGAMEKYFSAVELMGAAVEQIVACEKTWRHVLDLNPQVKFPGRGIAVLNDVRTNGIRVRWNHSMLRDPEIASQYLPGYESAYFLPWWADERNTKFAEEKISRNVAAFQEAGFQCSPYINAKSTAAEPRVVIQMLRGTVSNNEIKIDAHTGAKVPQHHKDYGAGDTFALAASEAAGLVVHGFAKYVDGRTKSDAYHFLNPGQPIPSHIHDGYGSGPQMRDDALIDGTPKVSVQYEGYAEGEISESVTRSTPGLINVSNR